MTSSPGCAGGLGDDEVAMLSMGLLFAGHETTVAAIGMGAPCLLAHPGQQQALIDDPGQITSAAEEILRAPGRGGGIPRYARTGLRAGEVTVRAGEQVLLDNRAASHDPAAFPSPDRFDITRQGPAHLSFGHGARYCLGAPLARIELQAVLSRLLARFPKMRLAVPAGQQPVRSGTLTGGLTKLPLEWQSPETAEGEPTLWRAGSIRPGVICARHTSGWHGWPPPGSADGGRRLRCGRCVQARVVVPG